LQTGLLESAVHDSDLVAREFRLAAEILERHRPVLDGGAARLELEGAVVHGAVRRGGHRGLEGCRARPTDSCSSPAAPRNPFALARSALRSSRLSLPTDRSHSHPPPPPPPAPPPAPRRHPAETTPITLHTRFIPCNLHKTPSH